MRQRHILTFAAIAIFALLIVLNRSHLKDLGEVARTYASFYAYIEQNPAVVYRFPPPSDPESTVSDLSPQQQVPTIIHQVFLQEGRNSILYKHSDALHSCRALHRYWTHYLWTDDNGTDFIREHYPALAPHYEGYQQSIQRANILRYALLNHYGGVYLDLDITCLTPLDNLLHLPWLTPGAYPAGVNNAFILSRPHHRFLSVLLGSVSTHNLRWGLPYVENMLSTGCMFFSNRWMAYARLLAGRPEAAPEEDKLYVLADQSGNLGPHMLRGRVTTPLFAHAGASSWHGWDAAVIVLFGKHYGYFLILLGVGSFLTLACVCQLWRRSRARRRSWTSLSMVGSNLKKMGDEECDMLD